MDATVDRKFFFKAAVLVAATLVLSFAVALTVFFAAQPAAQARNAAAAGAALAQPLNAAEDAVASADVRIPPQEA